MSTLGWRPVPTPERFDSLTDKSGECWVWVGSKDRRGYGFVHYEGRTVRAHRLAWMLACGDIPKGMHVLHRCDNTSCVRPDHLWLGTHDDNMADMKAKGRAVGPGTDKTHCPRGHAYSPENTYLYRGHRGCRTCRKEAGRVSVA